MTTLICAYVGPVMAGYLAGLGDRLVGARHQLPARDHGVERRRHVRAAGRRAGPCTPSSPAGRPASSRPGSSASSSGARGHLLRHGRHDRQGRHRPRRTPRRHPRLPGRRQGQLRRPARRDRVSRSRSRSSTWPRSAPAAGASPGSIRRASSGSARARPGAVPGPACYGRGGTEPTVTDANLVLGYLGTDLAAERAALARPSSPSTPSSGTSPGPSGSTVPERGAGPSTTSSTPTWPPPSGW